MLRFLSHIFGWHYEPCKGCEVLRTQLQISNDENRELITTILQLVKPQIIEQPSKQLQHIPTNPAALTFSRRRAELENAERVKNQIVKSSPFLAKPDDVISNSTVGAGKSANELERELGIEETKNA